MTHVVTVHTDFSDLNQMAEGLIGRVNETHVILPAQEPVSVGEWAQFAVTLVDGTPAFAGRGRCVTFVDNGEERMPHQRFDVVFDSLEFDPRGEQIHAHILALTGTEEVANDQSGDGGEVDVSDDFSRASESPGFEADQGDAPEEDYGGEGEATVTAGAQMAALAYASESMEDLGVSSVHPSTPNESYDDEEDSLGVTNRPPAPLNGASFHYPGGLPFPARPPRPQLDPSLRVTPAPRPTAASSSMAELHGDTME